MENVINSFCAFNVNGVSHFLYLMTSNWSLFLILISTFASIAIRLKEEVDNAICEEQNVL